MGTREIKEDKDGIWYYFQRCCRAKIARKLVAQAEEAGLRIVGFTIVTFYGESYPAMAMCIEHTKKMRRTLCY